MTVVMPDDRTAVATLTFRDAFGEEASSPGQVTWSVSDESVAAITPDAADSSTATVRALKGDGRFTVRASSGTLSGESEDVEIDPGAATSATIQVELTPRSSPQAARAIHDQ
jgi:hypothetical protein